MARISLFQQQLAHIIFQQHLYVCPWQYKHLTLSLNREGIILEEDILIQQEDLEAALNVGKTESQTFR